MNLRHSSSHAARRGGFTLIEIMIVVMIIGLLAMMAIPALAGAMAKARYNAIVNNLRVIQNQKQLWMADNKKGDNDTASETDLAGYFNGGKFPTSVMGETYNINSCGQHPTATIPSRLKMPNKTIEAGAQVALEEQ